MYAHAENGLYSLPRRADVFNAAIFVHELGHFLVARWRGLKIEGFAIGFGPRYLAGRDDGIDYSLRWIPAGGFVKLPQMADFGSVGRRERNKPQKSCHRFQPLSKILVAVRRAADELVFAFAFAIRDLFRRFACDHQPSHHRMCGTGLSRKPIWAFRKATKLSKLTAKR